MALPHMDANLLLHIQWQHLQMILLNAANQQGPPAVNITQFGWKVKEGIPSTVFAADSPAPPGLNDVISCGCKAHGKASSSTTCSCQKNQLSCTIYCMCGGTEGCHNPFLFATSSQVDKTDDSDYSDNE